MLACSAVCKNGVKLSVLGEFSKDDFEFKIPLSKEEREREREREREVCAWHANKQRCPLFNAVILFPEIYKKEI